MYTTRLSQNGAKIAQCMPKFTKLITIINSLASPAVLSFSPAALSTGSFSSTTDLSDSITSYIAGPTTHTPLIACIVPVTAPIAQNTAPVNPIMVLADLIGVPITTPSALTVLTHSVFLFLMPAIKSAAWCVVQNAHDKAMCICAYLCSHGVIFNLCRENCTKVHHSCTVHSSADKIKLIVCQTLTLGPTLF